MNRRQSEAVKAGIRRARQVGVEIGRPRALFDKAEARRLLSLGLSNSLVAGRCGVGRGTIQRFAVADKKKKPRLNSEEHSKATKAGLKAAVPDGVTLGRPQIQFDHEKARLLISQGFSPRVTAERCGVSHTTIVRFINGKRKHQEKQIRFYKAEARSERRLYQAFDRALKRLIDLITLKEDKIWAKRTERSIRKVRMLIAQRT